MTKTLFDKYGGFSTISKIVSEFYDKVTSNDLLQPYFDNIDMTRLMRHQTNFLAMVMGGPANQYTGRELHEAHKRLKITEEAFNEVARILTETLTEAKMEPTDVETLMGIVASVKDKVVMTPAT